ncbi:phospho-sugar mutase [Halobacillus shinanisalinarum]|uniref:Phosphoglucomutase n=1 Tax=Halobacillus shinanisalinarum TaxID=2932258 RepID=A0ABY4H2T0_9BACI|nr:phospho-sugar mutase [Halobacillus shinanisalinarum]UOQ94440.1 phospho-sugar mutase [Halobacillus shinanisalinarum]
MNWTQEYKRWQTFASLDDKLRTQLDQLQDDEQSLEDAYYKNLEFGTGGMRGKLGPGTNRMNIYTIRRAANGLATYVAEQNGHEKGVAIAYDSRYMSKEFAVETARVLGNHGIQSYVFSSLRPTPELSFAVRYLGAAGGVVITASHNPPEYNGFKVYNEDGGQMPPEEAGTVIDFVNQVENELTVEVAEQTELEAAGLLKWMDEEVDQAYLDHLKTVSVNANVTESAGDFSVVFTPLHGTAKMLVEKGLKQIGLIQVHTVAKQAEPDPEFSTVASPNPEEHQAFEMAIEKGKQLNADVLIATDPDADRLGIAVPDDDGEYQVLTGNQTGALMLDYLLSQSPSLPDNGIMIKTIVTSEFGRVIANHYGVSSLDTLTGFKFIGEKIKEYEETGQHTFLFGYEESYGYLVKDFARDKDAVQAAVLSAEVAAYWKSKGKTLLQALDELYEKHGYFLEDLQSLKMEGKSGSEQIQSIMDDFRANPLKEAGGLKVEAVEDYTTSERMKADGKVETMELPKANVLKFILEDDCWFCLRPSGTEPKIKFYYGVKTDSREASNELLQAVKTSVNEQIQQNI